MALTILVLGVLSVASIPIDILPVFKSPAVQTLTFYGGMPADGVANDITNRMERWVGQASGTKRQESRSIVGASIVSNYFQDNVDPNGALTQVNSLALAAIPNLPPGTLPPVVLPFDPTSTTPVCLVSTIGGTMTTGCVHPMAEAGHGAEMDRDMVAAPMVGDPDLDFVATMIPHHPLLR
jgi:multidrug efflux pump subunit AcrB